MQDAAYIAVSDLLRAFACDEDEGPGVDELIEPLIERHGWAPVRGALFAMLEADEPALWPDVMAALWGAVLDGREMDADRAIALVYHRLGPAPSYHDENLAWSIASRLKNAGHLPDYEPLADPGVVSALERLRE